MKTRGKIIFVLILLGVSFVFNSSMLLNVYAEQDYEGVIGTWANSTQVYVTNASQVKAGDIIITPNGEEARVDRQSGNYIFLLDPVTSWYGGAIIHKKNVPVEKLILIEGDSSLISSSVITTVQYNARVEFDGIQQDKEVSWKILNNDNITIDANGLVSIPPNIISLSFEIEATLIDDETVKSTKTIFIETSEIVDYEGVIGTWANSTQVYVTNASQVKAGDIIITPNGEEARVDRQSGNYIYLLDPVTSWTGGRAIHKKNISVEKLIFIEGDSSIVSSTVITTKQYMARVEFDGIQQDKEVGWRILNNENITIDANGLVSIPPNVSSLSFDIEATLVEDETVKSTKTILVETSDIVDYEGVIGTWANSTQVYVTNATQVKAGDIIITPNGEEARVDRQSGNYIYLLDPVTSWNGGKAIHKRMKSDAGAVKVINLNTTIGKEYNIALTGESIAGFGNKSYTLSFDQNELEVVDLAALTYGAETSVGAVNGSNINIDSIQEGAVTFSFTYNIPEGTSYSGILNIVRFRALVEGSVEVSFSE